jgi:hypothetical protein
VPVMVSTVPSAPSTSNAGHDVDFARNKARGDDRAFAVNDRRAIVDGGDHGQTGDVQLGQIQRQESHCADALCQDPCSRSDQLGIDDATVAALLVNRPESNLVVQHKMLAVGLRSRVAYACWSMTLLNLIPLQSDCSIRRFTSSRT